MSKLQASDLVKLIAQLGQTTAYSYYKDRNKKIRVTDIPTINGPINFVRWGGRIPENNPSVGNITPMYLLTAAAVFSNRPNYPIHFDRLFSAGGNSRSVFETLLAYTPNFFICYPKRVNPYTGQTQKKKLKHIMWCPDDQHPLGVFGPEKEYEQVISEVEFGLDFGNIGITRKMLDDELNTVEAKKTHTQMQVALLEIGNALNFRTWIAKNDWSIVVGEKRLVEREGVIQSFEEVPILYKPKSRDTASLIDCIWFSADGDHIPAVIEIEHSTGVTSGLTRMLKFRNTFPSLKANFTIVAPDELRNKVIQEANSSAFRSLRARFMPYSTVRLLYFLIQRFSLKSVVEYTFVEPFMEVVVED